MNVKLLIDTIVRQTMVLIAQLSTAQGVRSPLSHVADQVFLELAREIESQGVKRQVAADMFGLALRSYQKKVHRVVESASQRDRSLWQAVLEFIQKESPTRTRIGERFRNDGERELAAVVQDLLRSGLICATGSGENTAYGATSAELQETIRLGADIDALSNLIWLKVFHREATSRDELAKCITADSAELSAALSELLASGRVKEHDGQLESANLVVPVGAEQGWESAIIDHFRTVTAAIASKVASGARGSKTDDRTGGSTFCFTVTPEHPLEKEVYELFRSTRGRAQSLWDRVAQYNQEHPPAQESSVRISFYLGQMLAQDNPISNPTTTEDE